MVLLVTLKVRLYIVTKIVFAVVPKVFLLTFFCLNLSQSYWVSYILHRQPDKSDFINNVFTETGVLDKQECYLLGLKYQSNP